ncbi:MAG: hypothetical protein ACRDPI_08260 [Nocardioidaceae bacterium]
MTERVRVTGPRSARRPMRRPSVAAEIDAQTQLGEIYMHSLIRSQLRLALGVTLLVGLTLGLLPALFELFPSIGRAHLFGVPLPWVLLGLLVYPCLLFVGWAYVRRAESNEQAFSDLVER